MARNDYDYDELFPGRFLKAVEFKGRDVTLTITAVDLEEMPDKKGNKVNKDGDRVKVKPLLTFAKPDGQPVEKQMVLNRTNGECLKGMFGRKVSGWIGKRVTLFPVTVEAFGDEVPAIRVRGSPDLAEDIAIEMQLGQKTRKATLKKTGVVAKPGNGKPAAPAPKPAPAEEPDQPEEDFDPSAIGDEGEELEPASDGTRL